MQTRETCQEGRVDGAGSRASAAEIRVQVQRSLEAVETSRRLLEASRTTPRLSTVIGPLD